MGLSRGLDPQHLSQLRDSQDPEEFDHSFDCKQFDQPWPCHFGRMWNIQKLETWPGNIQSKNKNKRPGNSSCSVLLTLEDKQSQSKKSGSSPSWVWKWIAMHKATQLHSKKKVDRMDAKAALRFVKANWIYEQLFKKWLRVQTVCALHYDCPTHLNASFSNRFLVLENIPLPTNFCLTN